VISSKEGKGQIEKTVDVMRSRVQRKRNRMGGGERESETFLLIFLKCIKAVLLKVDFIKFTNASEIFELLHTFDVLNIVSDILSSYIVGTVDFIYKNC
jgi:hypothetical protein